jgi:hypothetical protein
MWCRDRLELDGGVSGVSVYGELAGAIQDRRVVSLAYAKDGAAGPRICHPHVVFATASGRTRLDAYQVGGYSRSGGLPSWRGFDLDDITAVAVLDERFDRPAPGYNPGNRRRYGRVLCSL